VVGGNLIVSKAITLKFDNVLAVLGRVEADVLLDDIGPKLGERPALDPG